MHICLRGILMMLLSVSLIGCLEVRNYYYKQSDLLCINTMIPNKSVFEPLTAKQIRKCYKLYPFDDFYSEYCPKILKCGHQEKVMFVDITWRSLFKYYLFSIESYVYLDEYEDYQDKCTDLWWELYGHYDKKVDSILNSWSKQVSDYFSKYIDVSLVKLSEEDVVENKQWWQKEEKKVHLTFELIPKSEPVKQCIFKYNDQYFRVKSDEFSSTITRDFSYVSDSTRHYHIFGTENVCIIKVSLLNGNEYSISDLHIPKLVEKYILSNDRDYRKRVWKEVFKEMYGISYDNEYGSKYINYSNFMSEKENSWKRSRYSREMDFVEALNKLE